MMLHPYETDTLALPAGFNYHLVKPARLEDLERLAAQDPRATLTDGPWQASSTDRGQP